MIGGSLEVKLPTICRDGKAKVGRARTEKSSEKIRDGESQQRGDAGARKGRKVAIHCVFAMIWGSGGSKSNLAKAAGCGASWPDERWTIARHCGAKHISKSKASKIQSQSTFGRSARRCGAKHISKSKCTKHAGFGPLFDVQRSKKCTPLWREAHFQVKCQKLRGSGHFLTFRCRPPQQQQQQQQQQQLLLLLLLLLLRRRYNYTTLHYTKRHYTKYNYNHNNYNHNYWGSRGQPFGEGTLSTLRRYLKPLPKGRGRGGGRGTQAPLRYLKGASKASKAP